MAQHFTLRRILREDMDVTVLPGETVETAKERAIATESDSPMWEGYDCVYEADEPFEVPDPAPPAPAMKFTKSKRYRVIKAGGRLVGLKPIQGGQQGWARPAAVGEILTCAGEAMTFGDGVPVIKWLDADGGYIANDCEFRPAIGGLWTSRPDPSYLEEAE